MYAWNIPQVDTGPLCSSMHEQALVTSVLRPGEFPVWEILTTRAGPTRNDSPWNHCLLDLAKTKCNKAWPRGIIARFRKLVVSSKLDKTLATTWAEDTTWNGIPIRYRSSGSQWK